MFACARSQDLLLIATLGSDADARALRATQRVTAKRRGACN
jgi:hypothetical protein